MVTVTSKGNSRSTNTGMVMGVVAGIAVEIVVVVFIVALTLQQLVLQGHVPGVSLNSTSTQNDGQQS